MKNIAILSLLLSLSVTAKESVACEPILHDARSDLANADLIIVGYVTGNRHKFYEAHILSGGDPAVGQIGDVLVRVAPTEALKGTKPTEVIEVVSDCMGTSPGAGARVVVIRTGNRYYLNEYSGYEQELRQVMRGGR